MSANCYSFWDQTAARTSSLETIGPPGLYPPNKNSWCFQCRHCVGSILLVYSGKVKSQVDGFRTGGLR